MNRQRRTRSEPAGAAQVFADAAVDSSPRGEFAYKSLIQAIRTGALRPGGRIREEEVARMLGISRTPVRQALQLLQARGLVEMAPGRGIVVMELSKRKMLELYAMREVLEGAAARFAAQHASATEISLMRQLLDDFIQAKGDSKALARTNRALHRAIYEAARNTYMQEALDNLEDALSLLPDTTFSLPERFSSALKEHRDIVKAIEERDSETAEAASRLHIREAQRARLSMIARG